MKKLFSLFLFLASLNILIAQDNNIRFESNCNLFRYNYGDPVTSASDKYFLWDSYQTSTVNQITDIQFGAFTGWATHTGMGLVYTTNHGTNWISVPFNDTNFSTSYNGVYFLDMNKGWAVGGALQIRKTTNGGLNWVRQVPPPIAGVLNSVYFFDASTGFAVGRQSANWNSCIIKTTNGGSSWTEIVASTASENELFDQYWFNSSTGWLCGKSFLMKTTNGGANFTSYYSYIPPTSNGINALLCINFINENTGWLGGSNLDHKNIYKTTNGGLNWVFQDNPVAQYTYAQINDIKFIDANIGWAAHGTPSSGAVMYTSNGGTNWAIDNGTNTWFDCLWTYNDAIVYCGAGAGKIWWSAIPSEIINTEKNIPDKYSLSQNYPNPFNPVTSIEFGITRSGNTELKVFDIKGREAALLVNQNLSPGKYRVKFEGSKLPTGIYFYKLTSGNYTSVRKMMLIK